MLKKVSIVMLSGILALSAPIAVMADTQDEMNQILDYIESDEFKNIIKDEDQVSDYIIQVKNLLQSSGITEDQIKTLIDETASQYGVDLDEETETEAIDFIETILSSDVSDEDIKNYVSTVYTVAEELGGLSGDNYVSILEYLLDENQEEMSSYADAIIDAVKGYLN